MPKQHQRVSPTTIPKDPIDDHKKYTLRKRKKNKRKEQRLYHSLRCLLSLQRNQHLPSTLSI